MLKINLLPPYINQKKQVKIASVIVAMLLAGEVSAMVAMRSGPLSEQKRLNEVITAKTVEQTSLSAIQTEAQSVAGLEAGLAPKFNFIDGLMTYNRHYPDLFERTAGYTYREVTFLNLSHTTNQLTFDAYVTEPAHVSLLMLGLMRSSDFQPPVQVTGVPGYNSAEEKKREEAEEGALPGSSIIGGLSAGAGGAEGGDAGAMGGMGGMGMGAGGDGNGPGGGPGMMSAGDSGAGVGMMGGSGAMGGAEGMGGGGGGGGDLSKFGIDQAVRKPKGFTVTVTCSIRAPIARPTYGTSEQQAGGGGGGGGMPGMGMGMGMPGMGAGGGGMNGP